MLYSSLIGAGCMRRKREAGCMRQEVVEKTWSALGISLTNFYDVRTVWEDNEILRTTSVTCRGAVNHR